MSDALNQGLQFMFIGMTGVFSFLVLMVIVMQLVGNLLQKYAHLFPEPVVAKPNLKAAADHAQIAIAIAAAHHNAKK